MWLAGFIISVIIILCARADEPDYEQLSYSVYCAEGGPKAKVPYGILSVKVSGEAEAKAVCIRTIKNSYKKWRLLGAQGEFIHHLSNKYCPGAIDNGNWRRNVSFFYYTKGKRRPIT